jgi:sec-independent protein translocase protein TatA
MAFTGVEWLIVIVAIILLLFGAKKIPEFARNIGKAKAEFQRGQIMVEKEIKEAQRMDEEKERAERKAAEKAKADEEKKEETELQKAARELGIDPEDKTDEELKALIAEKVGA